MYVFTSHGFYSVASARIGYPDGRELDPNRVVVRARAKRHLEALIEQFPSLLAGVQLEENDSADYRWRMVIPKAVWSEVVAALANDVRYDDFERTAKHDAEYHRALNEVWGAMFDMQDREEG